MLNSVEKCFVPYDCTCTILPLHMTHQLATETEITIPSTP